MRRGRLVTAGVTALLVVAGMRAVGPVVNGSLEGGLPLLFGLVVFAVLWLGFLLLTKSAERAARAGRKYRYSGDAVAQYRSGYSPYFGFVPLGWAKSGGRAAKRVVRRPRGRVVVARRNRKGVNNRRPG